MRAAFIYDITLLFIIATAVVSFVFAWEPTKFLWLFNLKTLNAVHDQLPYFELYIRCVFVLVFGASCAEIYVLVTGNKKPLAIILVVFSVLLFISLLLLEYWSLYS